MSVFQIYVVLSGFAFIMFSIMLSTNSVAGQILKAVCVLMSMFAFVVFIGSLGLVLPGSMRWM